MILILIGFNLTLNNLHFDVQYFRIYQAREIKQSNNIEWVRMYRNYFVIYGIFELFFNYADCYFYLKYPIILIDRTTPSRSVKVGTDIQRITLRNLIEDTKTCFIKPLLNSYLANRNLSLFKEVCRL